MSQDLICLLEDQLHSLKGLKKLLDDQFKNLVKNQVDKLFENVDLIRKSAEEIHIQKEKIKFLMKNRNMDDRLYMRLLLLQQLEKECKIASLRNSEIALRSSEQLMYIWEFIKENFDVDQYLKEERCGKGMIFSKKF